MPGRDEKQRRMELRRKAGNRKIRPVTSGRGPASPYHVAHLCFACRRSFKRRPTSIPARCPSCRGPAYPTGRSFKAPPSDDREQWRKVQALYAHGFRFATYGWSDGPPLPATYKEVAAFVRAHPDHPDRIGTPDSSLLPDR